MLVFFILLPPLYIDKYRDLTLLNDSFVFLLSIREISKKGKSNHQS